MPISVVAGGQFGSEGKGKVSAAVANRSNAAAVIRVGGTNSGHTTYDHAGRRWALRQIPAGIVACDGIVILPSGSIVDPTIFAAEVASLGLGRDRVFVSPFATLITPEDRASESEAGLVGRIGSTGSGTGAALLRRMARTHGTAFAGDHPDLRPYCADVDAMLDGILRKGGRVVIEGTQGFGLSLLHGHVHPHATVRDTTAAAFLAESGLSPRDVDDVTLVIRAFPIRVAGTSGPLPNETRWDLLARRAGLPEDLVELTTATGKVRRVAEFDAAVVRRAVRANRPDRIALNHMDYFDADVRRGTLDEAARTFVEREVEAAIGQRVDWIGNSPQALIERADLMALPGRKVA